MSISADPMFVEAEVQWRRREPGRRFARPPRRAPPRFGCPLSPRGWASTRTVTPGTPPAGAAGSPRRTARGLSAMAAAPRSRRQAPQPEQQRLETHAAMSVPSDIISGVGLDGAAARGVRRTDDEDAARLAELVGLDGDGGTGLVLLSGDAGIGKTRLLAETSASGPRRGLDRSHGPLPRRGRPVAAVPSVQRDARAPRGTSDPETSRGSSPPTRASRACSRPAAAGTSSQPRGRVREAVDRSELVEAAHSALEDLARRAPVLVVVEDVHWADQSSRDLLTLLFTRGFTGRVSIVASYRSDDLHRRHPLRTTLAHWSRLGASAARPRAAQRRGRA